MRGITRLAQELGLSTGTVSRALNDMPGVHERTRRRVLDAALHLGYQPNQAARTLALGQTRSIGFMMDLEPESAASGDSFFMGVFDGVQSVLTPEGLDLLVLPCPSSQHRMAYLDRVVGRKLVDGMIISGTDQADARVELLQAAQLPFVTLGRTSADVDFSWVDLDFETVAQNAVDRLVAQGHRRIALTVPFGDLNFGAIFRSAYEGALAAHGIAYDPGLVFQTGFGEQDGYDLVDELMRLQPRPTAIVLIFEVAAVGIYRRLAELGLVPGRDLAIIGFRDEVVVRHLVPSLTRYSLNLFEVGAALGHALLAQLSPEATKPVPSTQQKIGLTLIAGESDLAAS
jgi:DNA-binding LacI/PurR family transcriptional regulator